MKWIWVVAFALSACSTQMVMRPAADQMQRDRLLLEQITARFEDGQVEQTLKDLRSFQEQHPASLYLQASRLQEGQCLELLGRGTEARQIYVDVREKTLGTEPGLAALAEWRLSFNAESQGDDLKALSHVLSAESKIELLPEDVAYAELPARKAVLFHRLGRDEDANVAIRKAESGLRYLLTDGKHRPEANWLAKVYFEMGQSLMVHVNEDNFDRFLQAQGLAQKYLLKAMSKGNRQWSGQAEKVLTQNYTDYFNAVQAVSPVSGLDPAVGLRVQRETQTRMFGPFLQLIDQALSLRPTTENTNSFEKSFFEFALQMKEKVRAQLYTNSETMVLTEESRLLNGIRRAGRILDKGPAEPRPNQKKSPKLEKPDPNL